MSFKKNRFRIIVSVVLSLFLLQLAPGFTLAATNDAQMISDSFPETMIAGKTYTVSVTVKNTGSTTWKNVYNHRLTAVGGSDPFAKVNQYLSSSDSIAPGQSKTFSFVMTAPSSAGTYTTDWRMTQSSGGLFGETLTAKVIVESSGTTTSNSTTNSTTTISTTSTSTLTAVSANDAQIISDSIPEAMIAGKTYTVSVTVKNTGSTTWKNVYNYRLTAVGGSDPFARVNQYLSSSESIAPGKTKTFGFVMTAPASAGTYNTDWRMTQGSGGLFGEMLTAKVVVASSSTTTSTSTTNSTTTTSTSSTTSSSTVPAGSYNVKNYGAKGDGVTDDTAAINNAISYAYSKGGGTVYVPDGTYMINVNSASCVKLMDNIKLSLSSNATLKAKPSSSSLYAIVRIGAVKNVEVVGGKIVGDRNNHLNTSGQEGRGIQITGSNNVRISDVTISDSWGDGIYIGSNTIQNYSENVVVERVKVFNNRRSGITVISAKALTIRDATIDHTNGTLPQCGLNFEPNYKTDYLQNILVENIKINNCVGYGLQFGLNRCAYSANPISITVKNYIDSNNRMRLNEWYKTEYVSPVYKVNISVS